jgi:hypothetical protein
MRNKVVQGDNDLLTWCNNNGELGQLLKSQWVGYDIDKNAIDITSIAKSANKKVLWKCDNGHYWFAMVNNRTKASRHSMCPYCVGKKEN